MVVTVNVPAVPVVNVVVSALVIAGAWSTVSVKLWVASGGHAVGGGDGQRVGAAGARAGVPARVAVPSPLSTKVTPRAARRSRSEPRSGSPVVVTVNVPGVPVVNVVVSALVIAGRLVDGECEALGGVRGHAVGGGDGQRVGAAGARRGSAGESGGAVAVVHEGHARGQRPGLAQRRGRERRWW